MIGNATPVRWNGRQYRSLTAAARANGLSKAAMHYRIQKGYTCDEDMVYAQSKYKAVQWNGIQYPSVTAAAEANHVTVSTMAWRITRGYACDEDLAW